MDPIAHTFTGMALAAAGLRRATPLAATALFMGVNAPDVDVFVGFGPPFDDAARTVRASIEHCAWMVLPLREVPGAPAQGALAVEARRGTDAFGRGQILSPVVGGGAVVVSISDQPRS